MFIMLFCSQISIIGVAVKCYRLNLNHGYRFDSGIEYQ